MLIKITTKNGVIVTTGDIKDVNLSNGFFNLVDEGRDLLVCKNELLSIHIEDVPSNEQTYVFPDTNVNQWNSSVSSLITIKVRNKFIRKFLSWIFPHYKTPTIQK